jgi:outer membrane receptor for ferrienterochelin and colicin
MRKSLSRAVLTLLSGLLTIAAFSQTVTLTGNVKNGTSKETISAVSVVVKGTSIGTFTDDRGNFSLPLGSQKLPVTLVISSVGYESLEVNVSSAGAPLNLEIKPSSTLGQEVVIAATRTSTKILESPVSIERLGSVQIREAAAPSYYESIRNLKGVDMVTSGMLFNTPTTRGFSGSGNARLNQLVDGMDNQAPGLNFAVGSSVGLTELDVDNMELLPGASSALYGSGGMNGTLLINSKNPFKYQGFSFMAKQGLNHSDGYYRKPAAYYDWAMRWAKSFNNKLAIKLNAELIQAKDWEAQNYSNYDRPNTKVKPGTRSTDPNYDGVNVYGDETNFKLGDVSGGIYGNLNTLYSNYLALRAAIASAGLNPDALPYPLPPLPPQLLGAINAYQNQVLPLVNGLGGPAVVASQTAQWRLIDSVVNVTGNKNQLVSRTGYNEDQVVNYSTYNFKGNAGLFYKIRPGVEVSWNTYFGMGTTVYTGSDRYSLRNYKIGQHKLEFKGKNWFARAWTTQENAGDAFNATAIMRLLNEAQKPTFTASNLSGSWAPQYAGGFTQAYLTTYGTLLSQGITPSQAAQQAAATAHNFARSFADQGRLSPGDPRFQQIFDSLANRPISKGGAQFLDKTDLYMAEGQYNFSNFKFMDVVVGASWKRYVLNSAGTLFADTAGRINIDEYGGYVQLQKKLFKDYLSLTASGRFDKNSNFAGRFTPRVTALVKVVKDNHVRMSYQQAYRFPTTQNQWINLPAGSAIILGGLPALRNYYNFSGNAVYSLTSVNAYGAAIASGQTPQQAEALLQVQQFGEYKPESMTSYEVGYKGLLFNKKVLVDAYYFFGQYDNFLGRTTVLQKKNATGPSTDLLNSSARNTYSVSVNAKEKVKVQGWGASADWNMPKSFTLSANVAYNELKENNLPVGFLSYWATPKYRFNISLANNKIAKYYGFNITWRYQDGVFYESDFATGTIPSYQTLDAQISRKIPEIRSVIKLGASNLLNRYYTNGFGNPSIGGLYYISFGYNVF